jgi:hypothetical protein
MSPVTHFMAGWIVANSCDLNRRDRAIVTVAGVVPDLDSLGIIADQLTRGWQQPLTWFSDYHHVLAHNIGAGFIVTIVALLLSARRFAAAALAFLSFHVHLLCDLAGSRGPDGYQWPIHYVYPFSRGFELTWSGQWELNAWPNFLITALLVAMTLYLAWSRGFSPVEIFSVRADRSIVKTLRRRFNRRAIQ